MSNITRVGRPNANAAHATNTALRQGRAQVPNQGAIMPSIPSRPKAANKAKKEKKPKAEAPRVINPRRGPRVEAQMHPQLLALARSRADPWGVAGVKYPHLNNDAQSLRTFTTRTSSTGSFLVAAGECVQMTLFPCGKRGEGAACEDNWYTHAGGINPTVACGYGDAQAAHTRCVTFRDFAGNGSYLVAGPVTFDYNTNVAGIPTYTRLNPFAVLISKFSGTPGLDSLPVEFFADYFGNQIAPGPMYSLFTPLLYDTALPVISSTAGHVRWVMVSAGLKWQRTTPGLESGGTVVTVSLTTPYQSGGVGGPIQQRQLARYPSYHVSGETSGHFLPAFRPMDQCFNHAQFTDAPYASTSTARLSEGCNTIEPSNGLVFFNNSTSVNQSYAYEWVFNWEMAGDSVMPFTTSSPLAPQLAPAIAQAANLVSQVANATPAAITKAFTSAAQATSVPAMISGIAPKAVTAMLAGFNI